MLNSCLEIVMRLKEHFNQRCVICFDSYLHPVALNASWKWRQFRQFCFGEVEWGPSLTAGNQYSNIISLFAAQMQLHLSTCMLSVPQTWKLSVKYCKISLFCKVPTTALWPGLSLSCSSLMGYADTFHWVDAVMSGRPVNELRPGGTPGQWAGRRCAWQDGVEVFNLRKKRLQLADGLG